MHDDFLNPQTTLSRRHALALLAAPLAAAPALGVAAALPQITLAGPPAIVSAPLIHMAETGALKDAAQRTVFTAWRDPDQLRMMAMGGKADVLAMPSNVAANLFNRGAGVTLLNISTWGALWIVTRDAQRKTLADFKGEEIAVPFRGDMPDIVLQLLLTKQGLDPLRDFRIRYVPTPMEAMQLLITRRVSHALLSEPAVSLALRKTRSFPVGLIAPDLHRGGRPAAGMGPPAAARAARATSGYCRCGCGALTAAGAGCRGAGLCALACLVPRQRPGMRPHDGAPHRPAHPRGRGRRHCREPDGRRACRCRTRRTGVFLRTAHDPNPPAIGGQAAK